MLKTIAKAAAVNTVAIILMAPAAYVAGAMYEAGRKVGSEADPEDLGAALVRNIMLNGMNVREMIQVVLSKDK